LAKTLTQTNLLDYQENWQVKSKKARRSSFIVEWVLAGRLFLAAAAAVMIMLGYEGKDVFDIISKYRKMDVPDTKGQHEWVINIENQLGKSIIT